MLRHFGQGIAEHWEDLAAGGGHFERAVIRGVKLSGHGLLHGLFVPRFFETLKLLDSVGFKSLQDCFRYLRHGRVSENMACITPDSGVGPLHPASTALVLVSVGETDTVLPIECRHFASYFCFTFLLVLFRNGKVVIGGAGTATSVAVHLVDAVLATD